MSIAASSSAEIDSDALKKVFIVGCPRSGTTWLRLLLAQHESVATTGETRLFSDYLSRLDSAWRSERFGASGTGLGAALAEDDFYSYCTEFTNKVLARIASLNSGASVVVEKTPAHIDYGPLILKLIPDAYFIHIIRDPRSVTSSLYAASTSFGKTWASKNVVKNAHLWRKTMAAGHAIAAKTDRYREIRYEDLLGSHAPEELGKIFQWLDIPHNDALCREIIETCEIGNLRSGDQRVKDLRTSSENRPSFYRKGQKDSWKDELSQADIRSVEYVANDIMKEYGYSLSNDHISSAKLPPAKVVINDLLDGVEWRFRNRVGNGWYRLRSLISL